MLNHLAGNTKGHRTYNHSARGPTADLVFGQEYVFFFQIIKEKLSIYIHKPLLRYSKPLFSKRVYEMLYFKQVAFSLIIGKNKILSYE